MAQVKILKDALVQSYTTFKRNKAALSRAVENANTREFASMRSLKLKINALEESLNIVNASHTSWISKAEFPTEALAAEAYSNEWLEGLWEEVDNLCDKGNEIIHHIETASDPPSLQADQKTFILEEQMKSLQLSICNEIDILTSNTSVENLATPSHAVYTDMTTRVGNQLNGPFRDLSKSILDLSGANLQDVVTNHEQFHQVQHKRLLDVQINLAKLAPSSTDLNSVAVPNAVSTGSVSTRTRTVEMEKCKAPTFSGMTITLNSSGVGTRLPLPLGMTIIKLSK